MRRSGQCGIEFWAAGQQNIRAIGAQFVFGLAQVNVCKDDGFAVLWRFCQHPAIGCDNLTFACSFEKFRRNF